MGKSLKTFCGEAQLYIAENLIKVDLNADVEHTGSVNIWNTKQEQK